MSIIDGPAQPDAFIKNGADSSFMTDVIEPSRETPVIVDFWAPWCGPCKSLTPVIEAAVRSAKGKVRLVKINIDDHPGVAGQLGVRSIPAVFAFDKGRPVDGFMGNLPASQVQAFVERLAGGGGGADVGVEELLALGAESLALGDIGGAAQAYAQVLQGDQENVKAIAGLARVYLATGDAARAKELIDSIPADKASDSDVAGVRAALELAGDAADAGDPNALREKLAASPKDHATRFDLARALSARGDLAGAIDHLLTIIEAQRDWNEEAARKHLLKVFDAAGVGSDLVKQGRRRLSAILFS